MIAIQNSSSNLRYLFYYNRYFYLSLFEDEEIAAPADFEEEKRWFLFTALVLFYLKGVVAMTTTPSSGQV